MRISLRQKYLRAYGAHTARNGIVLRHVYEQYNGVPVYG